MYTMKTVCPYDCPTSCGFLVETDGKKIYKILNDKSHPVSGEILCRKMQNYQNSINSKDRILYPLKRTGEKGSGEFKRISWDEALNEISQKWQEIIDNFGPERISYCTYSGVMSVIHRNCGEAFFNYLGASQVVKTLCASSKPQGYSSVVGNTGCLDPRELNDSDLYVVWGSNMAATRLQALGDVVNGRKNGKKVILIEVYSEPMKQYCDDVILIKPGTDGAFAIGVMKELIENNLHDEEFLIENAQGYMEFKNTLDGYSMDWIAKTTGVPLEEIKKFALEYGNAKAPAIILGSGNTRYGNGAMTVRLITILSLFTGAWKNKGGGLCGAAPFSETYVDKNLIKRPDFIKNNFKYNINQLASALNGTDDFKPLKSLYVYGSNPVNSVSNQKAIIEGLKREDIFTVVHERFMTDTAKYADIILPATFSVEQNDIYEAFGYCTLATAKKIVDAPGECKSNWDTFCLLAKAMNFDDEYFKKSEEEMFEFMLDNPTDAVKKLSDDEKDILKSGGAVSMPFSDHLKFNTKSGKIEIINNQLKEPIPKYTEIYDRKYPINLISVPSKHTLNSIFSERNDLINNRGKMEIAINTFDAQQRNIKTGDIVICKNDLAEVEFIAYVTDNIAKGAAAAVGIYNSENSLNGFTANALHHERLTDMGESTTMNDNSIEILKK